MRVPAGTAALLAAAAALPTSEGFTNNGMKSRASLRRRKAITSPDHYPAGGDVRIRILPLIPDTDTGLYMAALPSAEESAKALSEYMAKSHEDKLRAVKDAEDKKKAEIQALKKEIEELKAGKGQIVQSTSPIATMPEGSKEELILKLQEYQKFMADYIVKAQEQKLAAVRAAEQATAKRYEEKLLLLGAAPGAAAPPAIAAQTPKAYADRNAKISAAAKVGKSRWGDAEIQRVSSVNGAAAAPTTSSVAPAVAAAPASAVSVSPPSSAGPVPPEVEAADHGLRADGGVGGPSLAQRVALGAGSGAASGAVVPAASASSASTSLYDRRNAMVSAAGKAGKSRWGEEEVQRSIELAGSALPGAAPAVAVVASPQVQAADHGLRADGGVGGPSLAERVNLGTQLLGK